MDVATGLFFVTDQYLNFEDLTMSVNNKNAGDRGCCLDFQARRSPA